MKNILIIFKTITHYHYLNILLNLVYLTQKLENIPKHTLINLNDNLNENYFLDLHCMPLVMLAFIDYHLDKIKDIKIVMSPHWCNSCLAKYIKINIQVL